MNGIDLFEGQRIQWPEHRINGGTGVSKMSGQDASEVAKSVKAFGDPEIFMRGNELHATRKRVDLSDFWEFHRKRTPGL